MDMNNPILKVIIYDDGDGYYVEAQYESGNKMRGPFLTLEEAKAHCQKYPIEPEIDYF